MSKPVVAIVGAGPGVSAGIARKFGGNGFTLVLLARTKESLERQVAELRSQGMDAHGLVADAADKKSLTGAFAQLHADFGAPEVLVYNAGANTICNPSELAEEDLLSDFTINVVGALTASQLVIPAMTERGAGTILFTGGMLGVHPVASRASASIAKAGLRNLAFTLSEELAPLGIKVGTVTIGGAVKPGTFFDPDLIADSFWELHTGARQGEVLYKQD
ncbi:SDR family NAD(P)-dependent oxidoreductase [Arthrobacter sp. H35-D1]|uniref:SDR family NAD(P)-dependent oxidoreductase n=1 Tax=Arthrobacter sp. H35-D1 TaxID=3046202 RepID=UPI0024BAF42E|nr:SDR family NAD(P)-dependent oxidoreductase [Arthrobacter sp. H35-D1]MDJ0314888.1 SDR family NAD(P)-dependent oxidoreductase [Arthrobacter sp. H35-D1]